MLQEGSCRRYQYQNTFLPWKQQAFGRDLERLYTRIASLDSQVILSRAPQGVTAALGMDDAQINRLLLQIVQVGNDHGIRFPRELGMLLKQLLYFDRWTSVLKSQPALLLHQPFRGARAPHTSQAPAGL